MMGGCIGRVFVQRVLGAMGEAHQGVLESRSFPTAGLSTGATRLGRNVTEVATCRGLLQPGALGTSAIPAGVSQLCGSCQSSSPMLSARHLLDEDAHGKDVQCPARCPLCTRAFARLAPRCLAGSVRWE